MSIVSQQVANLTANVQIQFKGVRAQLTALQSQVAALTTLATKGFTRMSGATNQLDQELAQLTAQVAQNTSLEQSAVAALNGTPALIQAAVQQALAAGATADELSSVTNAVAAIQANNAGLAAAITANTPAASAP